MTTTFVVGQSIGHGSSPYNFQYFDPTHGFYSSPYYPDGMIIYPEAHAHILNGANTKILNSAQNVYDNINDVKFSSYFFDYFAVNQILEFTVNLPARARTVVSTGKKGKGGIAYQPVVSSQEFTAYTFPTPLSYTPVWLGYDKGTNRIITTSNFEAWSFSMRIIQITVTNEDIKVVDHYQVYDVDIPAYTLNVRMYLLDQGVDISSRIYPPNTTGVSFNANTSRVTIGNGKIDTERRYIFADDTSLVRLPIDRSLKLMWTFNGNGTTTGPVRLELWRDGAIYEQLNGKLTGTGVVEFPDPSLYPGTGLTSGVRVP